MFLSEYKLCDSECFKNDGCLIRMVFGQLIHTYITDSSNCRPYPGVAAKFVAIHQEDGTCGK